MIRLKNFQKAARAAARDAWDAWDDARDAQRVKLREMLLKDSEGGE